jgi:hypothetical protein
MKLGTKTVEAATAVISARYMVLLLLYVARQSECGAYPKSLGVGGDVSSVQAVLRSRLSRHRSRGEIRARRSGGGELVGSASIFAS